MSDISEHNPGDHEDPLPGPTWVVLAVGAILLAVVVLGVAAMLYSVEGTEFDRKVVDETVNRPLPELETLRASQLARLEGPPRRELRQENDGKESLVIPLREAMALTVKEAAPPPPNPHATP